MLITFPSGSYYCWKENCGIYFWGVHSHDAIWHLSLVARAFDKIPFTLPIFSGANLSGYNYLYDLFIFLLSKIGVSPLISYFKLVPFVWFFIFTFLLIALFKKINKDRLFVGLALFFFYFTGSFSYYFTFYREKTIWGSSGYLAQMLWHIMLNPQFALSLLFILPILIWIKEKRLNLKTCLFFGLFIFINMGLKFYGGVATLIIVTSYFLWSWLTKRIKFKKLLLYSSIVIFFIGLSILIFYDPFSSLKSGSVFAFAPFAIVHPLTEDPSLFHLRDMTDARYFLQSKGIGPRLIAIELFNLLVFMFFYLGVRFFGMIYLLIKLLRRKINQLDFVLLVSFILLSLMTIFFVQKAEWWNTVQFFYYAIFLSTFYIAELSYILLKQRKIYFTILVIFFIILALPTTLDIVRSSAYFPGSAYLSQDEIEALEFLKKLPDGVVYSPIFNKKLGEAYTSPYPLFAIGDNAYVSAFSGKQQYLVDIVQLRLTGVDYEGRYDKIQKADCSIIKEIDYIYQNNSHIMERSLLDCGYKIEIIFGNTSASIHRVIK